MNHINMIQQTFISNPAHWVVILFIQMVVIALGWVLGYQSAKDSNSVHPVFIVTGLLTVLGIIVMFIGSLLRLIITNL